MSILVQSGIWLGVFLVAYKLLFERTTFFQINRFYLIIGLIVAAIIPFIKIENIVYQSVNWSETIVTTKSNTPTQPFTNPYYQLSWQNILIGIYISGVVVLSIRFVLQLYSLYRKYQNIVKVKHQNFYLSYTGEPITAFSFFNWIVLNNIDFSDEEQQIFVAHEKVHILQKHSIDVLLSHLLLIWQWFNPFAYYYKKSIIANLEFIADFNNKLKDSKPERYVELLLKTILTPLPHSIANNFNSSIIKKRIEMLHKNPTHKKQQWKYLTIIPFVALLFYAFNRYETVIYVPQKQLVENDSVAKKLMIILHATTSDEKLKTVVDVFKKEKADLNFSKIKRNEKGEIIGISITLTNENAESSYAVKGEKPIAPVQISMDTNSINIGVFNEKHKEIHWISDKKGEQKENTYSWTSKNDSTQITEKKIIIINNDDSNNNEQKLKITRIDAQQDDAKNFILISTSDEKDSLKVIEQKIVINPESDEKIFVIKNSDEADKGERQIKINGKIVTEEELKKMDPKEIKEIEITTKNK